MILQLCTTWLTHIPFKSTCMLSLSGIPAPVGFCYESYSPRIFGVSPKQLVDMIPFLARIWHSPALQAFGVDIRCVH